MPADCPECTQGTHRLATIITAWARAAFGARQARVVCAGGREGQAGAALGRHGEPQCAHSASAARVTRAAPKADTRMGCSKQVSEWSSGTQEPVGAAIQENLGALKVPGTVQHGASGHSRAPHTRRGKGRHESCGEIGRVWGSLGAPVRAGGGQRRGAAQTRPAALGGREGRVRRFALAPRAAQALGRVLRVLPS